MPGLYCSSSFKRVARVAEKADEPQSAHPQMFLKISHSSGWWKSFENGDCLFAWTSVQGSPCYPKIDHRNAARLKASLCRRCCKGHHRCTKGDCIYWKRSEGCIVSHGEGISISLFVIEGLEEKERVVGSRLCKLRRVERDESASLYAYKRVFTLVSKLWHREGFCR